MAIVHITDSSKPSLVMTSEVFKDKLPGSTVLFSGTGRSSLEYFRGLTDLRNAPDICIVDFDLPDTDGVTLIKEIRKYYNGPILLTAYPDNIVGQAVRAELFAFNDSVSWVPKPVRFDVLEKRIEQFLINKHRLRRRFDIDVPTNLVGKGAGRGKRAPKVEGRIVNISLGGVCIEISEPKFKFKGGEEFSFALDLGTRRKGEGQIRTLTSSVKKSKEKVVDGSSKKRARGEFLKGKIAWIKDNGKSVGMEFSRMSEVQKKGLEAFLKSLA